MKAWLFTIIGIAVVATVLSVAFVPMAMVDYKALGYTSNVGEVVSKIVIGQTFVANKNKLSEVAVMFATYSGRDNKQPIKFVLREFAKPAETIRTAEVNANKLGDNQLYRFSFTPLENSEGKTYVFLVESPTSVKGDAITVDLDNRDPYHFGSAYIIRGVTSAKITEEKLLTSGKASLDIAFSTYYQVPLWQASITKGAETIKYFKDSWQDNKSLYGVWAQVALQALLLIGFCWIASFGLSTKSKIKWLILIVGLGGIARLLYALELPFTNDEGNYLYDARTLLSGKLAGGDGYVKAPLVVLWMALWQMIGGQTLWAGRLPSIIISALTAWPIYVIAKEFWNRKAGICAAAIWSLLGVTTVFGIYAHTQPLAIFWGVSGIAVLLVGIRRLKAGRAILENKDVKRSFWWLFGAGLLLGLGVISRKSILALGLAVLLGILIGVKNWRDKIKSIVVVGAGFILVLSILLLVAWMVYGVEGFWEAVGFNSAADGIGAVKEFEKEQVRAYSLKGMTPFFRESLPLILLSMLGLGFVGEWVLASFLIQKSWFTGIKKYIPKLGWVVPLLAYLWAWSFFREYEGSSIMVYGMWQLWWAMLGVIIIFIVWPSRLKHFFGANTVKEKNNETLNTAEGLGKSEVKPIVEESIFSKNLASWLMPLAWTGGLIFFYMNWIKFHANYIGEFLPPLVIVSGVAIPEVWRRLTVFGQRGKTIIGTTLKVMALIILTITIYWALFVSGYVTYMFEHTGTFKQSSLQEAAAWAEENIPINEPIFTGAAAIPYLSGHGTALDIAHPRWYAYEFTRKDTTRINTFLPPIEEMLTAYRNANWFLHDKQTGFSFMMEYSEIEAGLATDWERVHGIENGSNTLTFYRRINKK